MTSEEFTKGRLSVLKEFDQVVLADSFMGLTEEEWQGVKKFFAINKQISKWNKD